MDRRGGDRYETGHEKERQGAGTGDADRGIRGPGVPDESEELKVIVEAAPEVPHAAPGAFERIKKSPHGHGEQRVLPDDCQFGDNDLCYVDA